MEDDKNESVANAQPGQTITPSGAPAPAAPAPADPVPAPAPAAPEPSQAPEPPTPETPAPAPEPPAPAPEPPVADPAPVPAEPAPPTAPEGTAQPEEELPADSQFVAETEGMPVGSDAFDEEPITWTASEFIAHAKSFKWYLLLGVGAIAGSAVVYVITRDVISAGVIIVAASFLGFYAGHKPRELEYRLDHSGLTIGQKHLGYNQFRSFSVLPEGAFSSIVFMPLKRFAVPTTIYYSPEDEDRIVNMLGSRLPLEQQGHDAVDRLMHRIHF